MLLPLPCCFIMADDEADKDRILEKLTRQAHGALPNGTRIVKINSLADDANPDGTRGAVRGSHHFDNLIFYLVEWVTMPDAFACVSEERVRRE